MTSEQGLNEWLKTQCSNLDSRVKVVLRASFSSESQSSFILKVQEFAVLIVDEDLRVFLVQTVSVFSVDERNCSQEFGLRVFWWLLFFCQVLREKWRFVPVWGETIDSGAWLSSTNKKAGLWTHAGASGGFGIVWGRCQDNTFLFFLWGMRSSWPGGPSPKDLGGWVFCFGKGASPLPPKTSLKLGWVLPKQENTKFCPQGEEGESNGRLTPHSHPTRTSCFQQWPCMIQARSEGHAFVKLRTDRR